MIIDCDPGVDDFLALVLALHSPELQVLGITTVCGNAEVAYTTWNATRACLLSGRREGVRVYSGARRPLQRPFLFDPEYCGKDGLCCSELEGSVDLIAPESAAEFLYSTLSSAREPVTIVSIAAMTNLAQVLQDHPEVKTKIKEIVTISGYYWINLPVARAEWNILFDPEAAQIVFDSGVPVRALGLDVTSQMENAYTEELAEKAPEWLRPFLLHSMAFIRERNLEPGGMLVDAIAVAAVIKPELADYRRGSAVVHPQCTDQHLTEFCAHETGLVQAAISFDSRAYVNFLVERVNSNETCNINQSCV